MLRVKLVSIKTITF